MCHEIHSIYKCGCVIVRPTLCNDSVNRTLCDVVSTEQKRLELKCSRCRQEALKKLTTAAAVPKQNPAIEIPLPTSNKRKATPEQEQERLAKKAKTQAKAEAKREKNSEEQYRKKLEYQKKYRQAQAVKKLAAEQEKKEVEALAMQAESEIAALSRAHAEEAQRQNDEEMTEEGILTASKEWEEDSEDADDESESEFESGSKSGSDTELACLSEFESEQDENLLPTPPRSPSTTPTPLTLRHNQPRHYHIPTADLLPCHGYYFRITRLAPWDNPLGEDGGCCKNCWLKVDGYTIKDMDREEKDGEGIKVAVLVRAWEMFEGGYWSEAD